MPAKIYIPILVLILLLSFSAVSFAAVPIDPSLFPEGSATVSGKRPTTQAGPSTTDLDYTRVGLTQRIVNVVMGVAGVVAILFILNNAWYLIISGGGEEKVTQHKKGLMWAIIGLILIILSYSIIRFIISMPFQADERPAQGQVQGTKERGNE